MSTNLPPAPRHDMREPRDMRADEIKAEAARIKRWVDRVEAASGKVFSDDRVTYQRQTVRLAALTEALGLR